MLLAAIVAFCVGCAPAQRAARSRLDLPYPAPLKMRPVRWHVIPQPKDSGKSAPFIALTEDGYKNLSQNFRDATNFIGIQRRMIESYKRYYEPKD